MSCTSCGTNSGSRSGGNASRPQNLDLKAVGTFLGGAILGVKPVSRSVNVTGLRPPNIVIFSEDPFLKIGDNLNLENYELAFRTGITSPYVTVTAAPVVAGTTWEVATNAVWTGTAYSAAIGSSDSVLCGGTTAAANSLVAKICKPLPPLSGFTGYVTTRPINTTPARAGVLVTNGSPKILVPAGTRFSGKPGDAVELSETNIIGANSATILSIAPGDKGVVVIEIDKLVGSITSTNIKSGKPCVDIKASVQAIMPISFTAIGNCAVGFKFDRIDTFDEAFPQGVAVKSDSICTAQQYCFVVYNATPGDWEANYAGVLELS
jgi:hypothetical protein